MSATSSPARAPDGRPFSFLEVLLTAAAFGLATGVFEVGVHFALPRVLGITRLMGRDYPWELPLANLITFATIGLLLGLAALLLPRLRAPRVVIACFGSIAAFAALLSVERIHLLGQVVLGVALGVALARLLARRSESFRRGVRLAVPAALLVLGGLAAWSMIRTGLGERRGLAALSRSQPGRPNILLIVLDTVRAWSMGLYGYSRATTPRLDEWANRGVVFQRALAPAPWTTLSHAVLFTGRHPSELSVDWDRPLDRTFPTLAEVLQDAGYATAGFVANYVQAGQPTGLGRGFLRYEDYPSNLVSMLRRTGLLRRLADSPRVGRIVGRRRMIDARPGDFVNRAFLRWLPERQERPWFAFLNYYEAHDPYLPPTPFDGMFARHPDPTASLYWSRMRGAYGPPPVPLEMLAQSLDAYDGAIAYLDGQVDQVLRALAQRGLLENTIVVVTSDHGELFGEHGVVLHGNNLYLPVLHVPLMIIAPGRAPEGARVSTLAGLRDLPGTLLEMAGVPNPGMPGRNLSLDWSNRPGPGAADTLFSTVEFNRRLPRWPPSPVLRGTMWSIVLDSLHYVLNGDASEELYHLGLDSWEIRNLAAAPEYQPDLERHRKALMAMPFRSPDKTSRGSR